MESGHAGWLILEDECENNYFTEMCSGAEAGSYLRLMDFVDHSTLGMRVIKNKKKKKGGSNDGHAGTT